MASESQDVEISQFQWVCSFLIYPYFSLPMTRWLIEKAGITMSGFIRRLKLLYSFSNEHIVKRSV